MVKAGSRNVEQVIWPSRCGILQAARFFWGRQRNRTLERRTPDARRLLALLTPTGSASTIRRLVWLMASHSRHAAYTEVQDG